jgi:two-component system KDP operon response regulator KdpE
VLNNKKQFGLKMLVIDDDRSIRQFLTVSLTANGFHVLDAANGTQAVTAASRFKPDVIILDLGLPDMDGNEVIRKIRQHSQIPIIILSVRDSQQDKIEALDNGADDYLSKPFGIEELLARLRAVLRRTIKNEEPVLKIGKLTIDLDKRIIQIHRKKIDLTPTEYDILKLLAQNAGKVLTHKQILKNIWNKNPEEFEGMDHLLRVTVSNLRNKLEPDPSRPEYIITEPAIGYRLKTE